MLQLSKAIGVPLTPVTYRGGAALATDVIGNHVPIGTDALASQLELHRSGKLRILGVTGCLLCCIRVRGDTEGGGREAGDGPSHRYPQPASARTT